MWQRIRSKKSLVSAAVCEHLWRHLQHIRLDHEIDADAIESPAHQISVEKLWRRELWLTPDNYGRIHSNVTNLARTLRKHLSVDGKRLANVDIAESQPLFFGMALAARYARDHTREASRAEDNGTEHNGGYHMMRNTMMDTNSLFGEGFDRKSLPPDLQRYLEACEHRALYLAVADRLGKTRDGAKHSVMVVLFDKASNRSRASTALNALFPSVMADIRAIKQPNYRLMAHFAQRAESRFMFGRVVPRIMAARPDLFVATIHDRGRR
jgi:hypothetical protein